MRSIGEKLAIAVTFFKRQLFACSLLLVACQLIAQTDNSIKNTYGQVSIASPTAGSLGKYADIPVNYHTGLPQTNIPIYTVKAGPLTLPISLSYHAGGLKVMEPASWVGAGWSLNAGGVITRTVVGAPDEFGTNNAATETNGHFSHYGYNSYLYDQSGLQDWQAFADGRKDGEPDLYFFNFNGYSGKFYFHDDRTPIIVPEQDLKIVPTYTGSGSIQSFVITTPDGVQYSFGNTTGITATEKTNPVTAQNGASTGTAISSWYLYKIATPDTAFSITLKYTPENYGYFTIAMLPVDGDATPTGPAAYGYNLVKNVVSGVRLSEIDFPNGIISFVPDRSPRTDLSDNTPTLTDATNTQAYALRSIQIKDGANTFCKSFNLAYDYFQDLTSPLNGTGIAAAGYNLQTDKYRLKLNSVQEISCDSSVLIPPYSFTYFSGLVPRRLTFGQDHWGYYNGVTNNNTLIPTYTVNGSNGYTKTVTGANRNSSYPAMQAGALQKIVYPTGGYSLFNFEPNSVHANYTTYDYIGLRSYVVHSYGTETQYSQTLPFTTSGSGSCLVNVTNNNLQWSCQFVITNSSGQTVYSSGLIDNAHPITNNSISLAPGQYNGTLSYPSTIPSGSVGAQATVQQQQYVAHSADITIGGLRIKTITHNDGVTSNDMVTSYAYNNSGILYSRPVYIGIVRNDLIENVGYWHDGTGFTPYQSVNGCVSVGDASYYVSPSTLRPMGNTQGYHIGYEGVQVSQTNSSSTSNNGYSLYEYYGNYNGNNPWDASSQQDVAVTTANIAGCDGNAPNYPAAPLPFEFIRGELKHEWHYNAAGQLLRDKTYTPTYTQLPVTTPAFIVVARTTTGVTQLLGTNYNLVNGKKTQMVTVQTDYMPGTANSIVTTTTDVYGSSFHHQSTSHSVVTSTGDNLSTKTKYIQDFRVASCDAISDGWQTYQDACSNCLATYNNTYNGCSTNSNPNLCRSNAYLTYMQCTSNARVNYVAYRNTNFNNVSPKNTFQADHDAAEGTADAILKPVLQLQDNYNNAPVEVTNWRNSQLLDAAYTTFAADLTNTATLFPSAVYKVNLAAPASTFTAAAVSGSTISKDAQYAVTPEAIIKYDNDNLVEVTPRNGVITAYIWGYSNTLPIVKATGIDYQTLKSNYTAANGDLNQLRSTATQYQQLNTYTYSPLIGMTSGKDPSGKKITYEYDALARLSVMLDQNNNILKKMNYQYQAQGTAACSCNDPNNGKKCINNQCEQATRVNLSTTKNADGTWTCTYYWQWSDGSTTGNLTDTNASPCIIN